MDFIIVTGMSGSGKSCVINALEDSGFFCVDNLPSQLIPTFAKLIKTSGEYSRVAVVTDIRAGISFGELFAATDTLKELEIDYIAIVSALYTPGSITQNLTKLNAILKG